MSEFEEDLECLFGRHLPFFVHNVGAQACKLPSILVNERTNIFFQEIENGTVVVACVSTESYTATTEMHDSFIHWCAV